MANDYSRERLQGSVLSMLTFTNDDYSVDLDGQRRHVRWLIDQGMVEGKCVHLIAGGAGETYMLEEPEFKALSELIIDEGKGVAPTMVMVSELSARAAARKCKIAADAGVDFVLLSPPHYSQPSEEDIYLHHKYVADRVDIGIMTYNSFWVMPGGYSYSPALFEKLADIDKVVGVKWTGTSTEDYLGFQQMFGDRFAMSENRQFFGMGARFGMKSRIDVMANAAPRLSLHQTNLTQEGRFDEVEALYRRINFDPVYKRGRARAGAQMVADGPHARMLLRLMGLETGPSFPGQAEPSQTYVDFWKETMELSGVLDWVDWDQSILD
jgi:dihydrodipicolinate synthase/N-acetylneuraminate lyase